MNIEKYKRQMQVDGCCRSCSNRMFFVFEAGQERDVNRGCDRDSLPDDKMIVATLRDNSTRRLPGCALFIELRRCTFSCDDIDLLT